jgi:hypothetical protein
MSTKEEIRKAAGLKFQTKEVPIDGAVAVTVREMSRMERDVLNAKLFVTDQAGKPLTGKVRDDGEFIPNPKGEEWQYREGALLVEEWLAATMVPAFTVEELQGPDWPTSLKRKLYTEALAINGVTLKDAAGN